MFVNVEINNVTRLTKPYVVVRLVNTQLWYYGQYDDKDRAEIVSKEIGNGFVVSRRGIVAEV